jgi:hypothetical protein
MALGSVFIPPTGDASSLTLRTENNEAVRNAQAGDLIFRLGKSVWSPYFGGINSYSGFSHVGVLIEVSLGRLAVVHAEADDDGRNGAVKLTSLEQFIHDSLAYEIKSNLIDLKDIKSITGKYVIIKSKLKFQLNYRYHTNDQVKNYDLNDLS